MKITYQVCPIARVDVLLRFIDSHWKKNHILTNHRELLDWQYKNAQGGYNFVLAMDEYNELQGVLGYIPTSQFSASLPKNDDVWLAIWKVRNDCKILGLGLGMLNYARKTLDAKYICALGISEIAKPIYQSLNFIVGTLDHFVAFNVSKESFSFVCPLDKPQALPAKSEFILHEMSCDELEDLTAKERELLFIGYPTKNVTYLVNRFLLHPIYSYKILAFYEADSELHSLIVVRVVEVEQAKVARIVDAFGHSFLSSDYNRSIYTWLEEENCEYMDCMAYGLNTDHIESSCFCDVKNTEELVIPNYFEPLVRANIPLDFAFKSEAQGNFRIFKGDSDQDRPNLI